jgi:hypothetical protein
MGGSDSGLHPQMFQALMVSLVAFLFLYIWMLQKRVDIERAEQELDHLHKELETP